MKNEPETLEAVVALADSKHQEVLASTRNTLLLARDAGQLYAEVKRRVGHGQWDVWLKNHHAAGGPCPWTVRGYIRIHRKWAVIEKYLADLDDPYITVSHAFVLLRQPEPDITKSPRELSSLESNRRVLVSKLQNEIKTWTEDKVCFWLEEPDDGPHLSRLEALLAELTIEPGAAA